MRKTVLLFFTASAIFKLSAAQLATSEVIKAEKAFAKLAIDQNTQAAFLANMSENTVIDVRGKFANGLSVYSKLKPDTTGKLYWRPVFATISRSGDVGYTTGPYKFSINGKEVAFGDYATVWEKQANGQWKIVIDLGNSHPPDGKLTEKDTTISLLPAEAAKETKTTDLFAIDKDFSDRVYKGSQKAYLPVLHPQARILRNGYLPAVSDEERRRLLIENMQIRFIPQQFKIAFANDLGVVYGLCEIEVPEKGLQHGVYMHVWRKDGKKGWQILHETIKLKEEREN